MAKVIPLHKGGEKIISDNYRPISLLLVISKVIECVVYNIVVSHLEKHNALYPRQYGFRRNHSTSYAALNLLADVLEAFDKNLMVLSVFVDLKKAFDTVSHEILVQKLKCLGIPGAELTWFKSYLSARKQTVEIEHFMSDVCEIS